MTASEIATLILGSGGAVGLIALIAKGIQVFRNRKRVRITIQGHHNWCWTTPAPEGEVERWKIEGTVVWVLVTNLGRDISLKSISMSSLDESGRRATWTPCQSAPVRVTPLGANHTELQTYLLPVLLPEWRWRSPLVEVETNCGKRFRLGSAAIIKQFNETIANAKPTN